MESDSCLLAGVDFCGAMVVDLGLGICKHKKKKKRNGKERAAKFVCVCGVGGGGGGNEHPFGYLKGSKIRAAMPQRRALRCGETWLRSGVGLYAVEHPKVG